MTKCSIKIKFSFLAITVIIAGIFLFPHQAHAAFLDFLKACDGNRTPSLSGFLFLFIQIAQWILGITGSLALLMFVIGGFTWLISAGRQKWVDMGTTTLFNALIGLLIVFGSWFLIDIIISTVAPGVRAGGGWYTFDATLCTDDRTAVLGDIVNAPPPKEIFSIEEKHSEDKALPCMDAEKAEDACGLAEKKGDRVVLTDVGCPAGKKRCDITSANGITCDVRFNNAKGYINTQIRQGAGCPILCGRKLSDGERFVPSQNALCCKCIDPASANLKDKDCGQPVAKGEDIGKGPYKCCESNNPSATVTLCKKGEAFYPGGGICYCTLGLEGSICTMAKDTQSGCKMTNLSCKTVEELERYIDCSGESGTAWFACKAANISRGLVRMPSGWVATKFKDLRGQPNYGICIKNTE